MKSKYFIQGVLFILFSMLLILTCHSLLVDTSMDELPRDEELMNEEQMVDEKKSKPLNKTKETVQYNTI